MPESMQTFIYKKMSTILNANIEFITVASTTSTTTTTSTASPSFVKLLRDTEPIRLEEDAPPPIINLKRKKIFKKRLEQNVSESERLQASVIDSKTISAETAAWKDRRRKEDRNLYHYRDVQSKLYLVEADNEFTKQRKRNNWTENKIARK